MVAEKNQSKAEKQTAEETRETKGHREALIAQRKAQIEKAKDGFGRNADENSSENLEIEGNEEYNGNVNYSMKVDQYTEEEYENYGWVRANNVMNEGEYAHFTTKFADAVELKFKYPKSKRGEFIIPVSDMNEPIFRGTENVFCKICA